MDIFSIVRGEIQDFIDQSIEVVPGYTFNQYQTIKRAHLYMNSKFEMPSTISGRERLFYNIIKYRQETVARMLNIDTKDIRLVSRLPDMSFKTYLFEQEFKYIMKVREYNQLLRDIERSMSTYGSALVKKVGSKAIACDLRRTFLDPTVDRSAKSRFITIKHYFTASQLRENGEKKGWNKEAIEQMIREKQTLQSPAPPAYEQDGQINEIRSSPYFEVYERFGEVPLSFFTNRAKDQYETVRALYVVSDIEQVPKETNNIPGKELFKGKWNKPWPFHDFHLSKTEGRWLGIGVPEELFDAQERRNEVFNQRRISMEISGMHLFQTQGNIALTNVLKNLENGAIVRTGLNGTLSPIPNEERNLSAFSLEDKDIDMLADKLTFTFDAVRGEAVPASTPATNTIIQNQNAMSLFQYKREAYAIDLQKFLNDFILPEIRDSLSKKHIVRFMGSASEIERLDSFLVQNIVDEEATERLLKGKPVTAKVKQSLISSVREQLLKRGNERYLEMKDNGYEDLELEFDFNIVNEQENTGLVSQNLYNIFLAVSQNPTILQNPVLKRIFYQYAEKVGVSPMVLEQAEASEIAANAVGMPQANPQQQLTPQMA